MKKKAELSFNLFPPLGCSVSPMKTSWLCGMFPLNPDSIQDTNGFIGSSSIKKQLG